MDARQRIAQRVLAEHEAIADRLRKDPTAALDYARGNIARWTANFAPDSRPAWLADWERLITGPLDALLVTLTADTEANTRLRALSPFVGLLTFPERLQVMRRVDPEMARAMEVFQTGQEHDVCAATASVGS